MVALTAHPAFYAGGINDIDLTLLVGLLLAFVGGAFLVVEAIVILNRERDGRTGYHRTRRQALTRIGLAAAAVIVGVALIYWLGPTSSVP